MAYLQSMDDSHWLSHQGLVAQGLEEVVVLLVGSKEPQQEVNQWGMHHHGWQTISTQFQGVIQQSKVQNKAKAFSYSHIGLITCHNRWVLLCKSCEVGRKENDVPLWSTPQEEKKERKKIGTQNYNQLIFVFVFATLCVTVDAMHASAHSDLASLFTRPSMHMPQGCIGNVSMIGATLCNH